MQQIPLLQFTFINFMSGDLYLSEAPRDFIQNTGIAFLINHGYFPTRPEKNR
jgi:hypothetical protein